MSLVARDVQFGYGGRPVLKGVTLGVEQAEILALCGPNGAGKSTLLHVLGGLRQPAAGEVSLDGSPLSAFRPAARAARIAVVPQSLETAFDITVEDLVALGRLHRLPLRDRLLLQPLRGADRTAVEEALRELGLGALRRRQIGQLSGGERARALLATALAQGADHLLLDEPTAHLDPAYRQEILEILRRLAASGKRILIVLHDLTLAGLYADRVALLEGGQVKALGSAEEVLREDVLCSVFHAPLRVLRHPDGGRPVVLPAPTPQH
ncbi:MAG: ABC transporter ATP-binding protein [Thermaerobacter sp.]|nr:ABC transporter ATP-binding protein [Thermaerobacter sp.]